MKALAEQGKPGDAMREIQAWLAHPPSGTSEPDLAVLYLEAGRDAAAAGDGAAARRFLAQMERRSPAFATMPVPLAGLRRQAARVYLTLGDFRMAAPLLSAVANSLRPTAPRTAAEAANELGSVRLALGEADASVAAFKDSLDLLMHLPMEPKARVAVLANLSNADLLANAILQAGEAAAEAEQAAGDDPGLRRIALIARAQVLLQGSDILAAEMLLKQLAATPGRPADTTAGYALYLLAKAQYDRGLYPEADDTAQRALPLYVAAVGPTHPDTGRLLHLMGLVRDRLGDLKLALALLSRDAAIAEAAAGSDSPLRAASRVDFARVELDAGRLADARRDATAAVNILTATAPSRLHDIASAYIVLGMVAQREAASVAANRNFQKARTILQQVGRPGLGLLSLLDLMQGRTLIAMGRLDTAQIILQEADAAYRELGAQTSTRAAEVLMALAEIRQRKADRGGALERSRLAYTVLQTLLRAGGDVPDERADFQHRTSRDLFIEHAARLVALQPGDSVAAEEAFAAVQEAERSRAAEAIRQASVRLAFGEGPLALLVRRRSDLQNAVRDAELRARTALAVTAAGQQGNTDQTEAARAGLIAVNAEILQHFPKFAEFTGTQTVSLAQLQAALKPNEAVVMPVTGEQGLLLWAVTSKASQVVNVDLSAADVATLVRTLRRSLDLGAVPVGTAPPPFDQAAARKLNAALIAPVDDLLRDATRLIYVPDGPLETLPLHVLLGSGDDDWLIRRFAVEVVPSAAAFLAQRNGTGARNTERRFLGVGNPVLENASAGGGRGLSGIQQMDLRQALMGLQPLPETADELRRMAGAFDPSETRLMLGRDATGRAVMDSDLSLFSTIAFATHAVMAGELPQLTEPAIVLTRNNQDDTSEGLLTASQIATLRLTADVVILSACNTAAPDGGPFADGFSGLTRAFLYAGARSLLVSHWSVSSLATVELTTAFLDGLRRDTGAGKAEALRQAMLRLLYSPNTELHQPAYWAPFVVLGE